MRGHDKLYMNMQINRWERVVRTRSGAWQPFYDGDAVIASPPKLPEGNTD